MSVLERSFTMENDKPTFYNAKEVAELYFDGKISYRQVLAMTRKGTIPGFYEGRCFRYPCIQRS